MKKLMILILIMVVVSACGGNDEQTENADIVKPIKAELNVPEKSDANTPVTFSVTVSQDGKAVKDTSEIEFEIWQESAKSESVMIKGSHTKDGIYTAQKSFNESGIYIIQSHVTARDMHTMPKTEITIGKIDASNNDQANESGDEHHHYMTTIDLQKPEMLTANKNSSFVAIITHNDSPLKNARVRLEVWKDGSEKHNYVNLDEDKNGNYQTEMKLEEKGTYHITVHVEKEEIHSHKEFKLEVN